MISEEIAQQLIIELRRFNYHRELELEMHIVDNYSHDPRRRNDYLHRLDGFDRQYK